MDNNGVRDWNVLDEYNVVIINELNYNKFQVGYS